MTPPARWGSLVAREVLRAWPLLVASCAAPPPAAPPAPAPVAPVASAEPPEPPAPPLPASSPDPEGARAGLGPAVVVVPAPPERYRSYRHTLRFGGGYFSYIGTEIGIDQGDPRCSLPGLRGPRCAGVRVAPWTDEKAQERWPQVEGATAGAWGPVVGVAQRWERFSPGKSGVYASRSTFLKNQALVVDFIDARGATREVFSSERLTEAEIVETPAGLRAIGLDREDKLVHAVIDKGEVVALRALDIGDIPAADSPNSMMARFALEKSKRASYGPWRATLLPPEKDGADPSVALVWVEVIPPRKIHRARNQCARPNITVFENATRFRAGHDTDHGCGVYSRDLSSASARKRLHVTRLSLAGEMLADPTFPLPALYDATKHPLDVRLEGKSLLVDERAIDLGLKGVRPAREARPPEQPAFEGPGRQSVVSAAFDVASGEGMLVFRQAPAAQGPDENVRPEYRSHRFDALGQLVGHLVRYSESSEAFSSPGGPSLVRVNGRWHQQLGIRRSFNHAQLAYPGTGKDFDLWTEYRPADGMGELCDTTRWCSSSSSLFLGLAASADGKGVTQYLLKPPGDIVEGTTTLPDDKTKEPERTRQTWAPAPPHDDAASLEKLAKNPEKFPKDMALGGRPLIDAGGLVRGPSGKPVLLRRRPGGLVELGDGESWARAPGWPEQGPASYSLHGVWGDTVLVVSAGDRAVATWLRRGKSVELAPGSLAGLDPLDEPLLPTGDAGPVLPGARWALPATPGPALPLPAAVAELRPLCPVALPTGPRRLVLACSTPAAPGQPAAVVNLRVLRY